mgnify:CR=1 FL=1
MNWAASLFASVIEALSRRSDGQRSSLATVGRSILRYPIKTHAAFLLAPILALRTACVAKDPVSRVIAGAGLVMAVLVAWGVGAVAGGLAFKIFGFFEVAEWFGWTAAVGCALFGVTVVSVSVVLSAVALNANAWCFLHMSSQEVVDYLRTLSE